MRERLLPFLEIKEAFSAFADKVGRHARHRVSGVKEFRNGKAAAAWRKSGCSAARNRARMFSRLLRPDASSRSQVGKDLFSLGPYFRLKTLLKGFLHGGLTATGRSCFSAAASSISFSFIVAKPGRARRPRCLLTPGKKSRPRLRNFSEAAKRLFPSGSRP